MSNPVIEFFSDVLEGKSIEDIRFIADSSRPTKRKNVKWKQLSLWEMSSSFAWCEPAGQLLCYVLANSDNRFEMSKLYTVDSCVKDSIWQSYNLSFSGLIRARATLICSHPSDYGSTDFCGWLIARRSEIIEEITSE